MGKATTNIVTKPRTLAYWISTGLLVFCMSGGVSELMGVEATIERIERLGYPGYIIAVLTRKVDGLRPNTRYDLGMTIAFASNAQSGCVGIGGAPGESVWLKAGATDHEPQVAVPAGQTHLRVHVDIGAKSQGGADASVVDDIANGTPCDPGGGDPPYVALERTHQHVGGVTSNAAGEIWLVVGSDSGFEGTTALYYRRIDATLGVADSRRLYCGGACSWRWSRPVAASARRVPTSEQLPATAVPFPPSRGSA
jgi:hypothetical protein